MKIIVKTLSGKQLPLEIEETNTIRQIKEKIEETHEMKADTLKLIAYGKVLDSDDKVATEYNIKEGDFIVAMVQKAKKAPAAKPKPAEPAPVVADNKEEVKKDEPAQAQPANPNPPVAQPVAAEPQPAAATNPSAAATNPPAQAQPAALTAEQEASVAELMAISQQPRDLCIRALNVAHNIPDVAFELLMSGQINEIPEGAVLGDAPDEAMEDEGADPGAGAGGAPGGLGQYNLDQATLAQIQALVSNPSFPMIRERMIQDPNFSAQFMQQLQNTQPQIFNAIQQNPGILMALILGHDPMAGMPGGGAGAGQHAGAGGMGQQQPPPGSIQVTPEEMEQINTLVSYGFPKARAAEAFFACDKNVEMAANFLFEAGADDEDTAMQNAINASTQEATGANAANPVPAQANAEPVNVPVANPDPADVSANANNAENADAAEGGEANAEEPKQQNNENNNNEGDGNAGAGGDAAGGEGGGSSLV